MGAMRSGTTLLRLMLTSHPAISIPPESLFFVQLMREYGNDVDIKPRLKFFLKDLYEVPKFIEWKVDIDQLIHNLSKQSTLDYASAISCVYKTYMDQFFPDAHIWGDKNPGHVSYIDQILKYFPSAKIVHIVRDVRAIYSSIVSIHEDSDKNRFWKNTNTPLLTTTKEWTLACRAYERYGNHQQCFTICYENLVSDPGKQLQNLCSWIGVDYDESMLRYYEENASRNLVPPHRLKWHQKTLNPVDPEQAQSWRDKISSAELQAIELMNRRAMKKMGYDRLTKSCGHKGLIRMLSEHLEVAEHKLRKWSHRQIYKPLFNRKQQQ